VTVVNLERRTVERLALELEPYLKERGTLVADLGEVGDLERWRKAARMAGRSLGQPVRTMVSSDGSTVFAFLNGPVEPGERTEAADRVANFLFGSTRHLRLLKPEAQRPLVSYDE
jgi:hypothetical protein